MRTIIFILIYLILAFISGSLYYIYQDKIKELIDENDCLDLEESPVESLFIGLVWPLLIPGILVIYLFKQWINFLEKIKKVLDK